MDGAERDADDSPTAPPPTFGGADRPEPDEKHDADKDKDKDTDTDIRRTNDAGDDTGSGNSQDGSRLTATRLSSMVTHNGRDIAELLRQHDHDSIDGGNDDTGMQVGDVYTEELKDDDTPNGDSGRASSTKKGTWPGRKKRGSDASGNNGTNNAGGSNRSRSGSGDDSKGVVSFLGNLSSHGSMDKFGAVSSVDGDSIGGSSAGRLKGLAGNDNGRSKDRRGSRCSVDSALSDTTRTSTATTKTDAIRNVWSKLMRREDAWGDIDDLDSEYGGYSSGVKGVGEHITEAVAGAWGWTTHTFRVACTTPSILLATLLVFAIFCAATVSLVVKFTDDEEDARLAVAREMAEETGLFFSRELDKALVPLFTMSQFVYQLPAFADLPRIIGDRGDPGAVPPEDGPRAGSHRNMTGVVSPELWDKFNTIAAGIKKSADMEGVLVNVQLAPQAVVSMAYPLNNTEDFEDGMFLNSNGAIGHDLLNDPNRVAIARATVPAPGVVIAGPLTLIQGDFPVVRECFIARLAINMPGATPPYDITVDGISYESWGFAVVLINWEALKDRSNVYERFNQRGMFFQLTRTDEKFDSDTNAFVEKVNVIAQSPGAEERLSRQLGDVVDVALPTTNNEWVMTVGYEDGSRPNTEKWAIPLAVIGSLLVALLVMTILVGDKDHRQLLYKMMPAKAIKRLRKGKQVVERYDTVTIFFSDIVGFTSMAGEMSPEDVMQMLNELYTELDKLVEKHGVYKVETIGDAYMVLGGAPQRCMGPEGAEKVALFALDALEFVKTFKTSRGDKLFIRAGLASGPVVAGVVGQAMPRWCLFGDTVNFASRMESTSVKMRIQCSSLTYRLLRDAPNKTFEMEERREGKSIGVEVKGKGRQNTFWINSASKRVPFTEEDDFSSSTDDEEDGYRKTVEEASKL